MRIEKAFPEGEWKGDEYIVACPVCGDHPGPEHHKHCHINVRKGVFYCHYQGCYGTLRDLLQFAETGTLEIERPEGQHLVEKKVEPTDFSKFEKITGKKSLMDEMAFKYLIDRGLSQEEIARYDIRYCRSGRYFGRVIIPIYENGEVVCFVSRNFIPKMKPIYLYPYKRETLFSVSKVIFGLDSAIKTNALNVVITEGIFDAIAVDRISGLRGLAILGHHLSNRQLRKLLQLSGEARFFICMDADMPKDTIKIVKRLSDQGRIARAVLLQEGDPASISKEELITSLKSAERYSHDLELRILLKEQ